MRSIHFTQRKLFYVSNAETERWITLLRKKEALTFLMVLALCLLLLGGRYLYQHSGSAYGQIRITVSGTTYGIYDLAVDQVIAINDTNVCTISDGCAVMTQAECPDHVCMNMSPVGENGGQIICLPNHVVIEGIRSGSDNTDAAKTSDDLPDMIVS